MLSKIAIERSQAPRFFFLGEKFSESARHRLPKKRSKVDGGPKTDKRKNSAELVTVRETSEEGASLQQRVGSTVVFLHLGG